MSGNSVVLDTNIVLYLLNGDQVLSELLDRKKLYLSLLLGFKGITLKQQLAISKFIQDCIVIDVNEEIKREVISLRKKTRLKLPDCIIVATARFLGLPFITSDVDFKSIDFTEVIIYE